jgi:hypothetical protein
MINLQTFRQTLLDLETRLKQLQVEVERLSLPSFEREEWYLSLQEKLLPQLQHLHYYIAAIMGGTNIGKSSIFNHLAGYHASGISPLASGTKHPFCLVPEELRKTLSLQELFPDFELVASDDPRQMLEPRSRDTLFYQYSQDMPQNLLILDTPDVDSVAKENWERADKIRRAADVLIAVITPKNHNDLQIRKFFQHVATEDKVVFVILNQCQLPEDEAYWPEWIKTFTDGTGLKPYSIYLAPHDRPKAEQGELPFYQRAWPVLTSATAAPNSTDDVPHNLMRDLSELRFDEIKMQTITGAVRQLTDVQSGVPRYLSRLGAEGAEYRRAMDLLHETYSIHPIARPEVAGALVSQAIRKWWGKQREGYVAKVHGFYDTIGVYAVAPFKYFQKPGASPWDSYRQVEWNYVLEVQRELYKKLGELRERNHPFLNQELDRILSGESRRNVDQHLKQALEQTDYVQIMDHHVAQRLQNFKVESENAYLFLNVLDQFAAIARPGVSAAMFMTGFGSLGIPFVADGLVQLAGHVAGGGMVVAVGDPLVGYLSSWGFKELLDFFNQIRTSFVTARIHEWQRLIQAEIYGDLASHLLSASEFSNQPVVKQIEKDLSQLRAQL